MRKLPWIFVLACLAFVVGGVAAADEGELNSELNSELNGASPAKGQVDQTMVGIDSDDLQEGDAALSGQIGEGADRGDRMAAKRRGRQARRGQTVINLSFDQAGLAGAGSNASAENGEGSDSNSGKDMDEDEDEDGETPTAN